MSLPSRERGLKLMHDKKLVKMEKVAPFAGAWIEMTCGTLWLMLSIVAPFAGAWIEIRKFKGINVSSQVAPFAGAWIEITTST